MCLRCFFHRKWVPHKSRRRSESALEIILRGFDWGSRQLTCKKQHMSQDFVHVLEWELWYVWLCYEGILYGIGLSSPERAWIWFFHHSKCHFWVREVMTSYMINGSKEKICWRVWWTPPQGAAFHEPSSLSL